MTPVSISRTPARPTTVAPNPAIANGAPAAAANGPAPGNVPNALAHDSYHRVDPSYTRPSATFGTSMQGYRWDADALDEVMKRFCVADPAALVRTAMALDCGDRYLSRQELMDAASIAAQKFTKGFKWSPTVLADVMTGRGIAEETALVRAASRVDDGDKVLSRAELEHAADVLTQVVSAHDYDAIRARVAALEGRPGLKVETLGEVDGKAVQAVHFPCTGGTPRLRLLVSGGVHGNEPCGAAAAMLLVEQLLANPKMRQDMEVTVVPVVNPRGLVDATRRTPEDVDLNRTFHHRHDAPQEAQMMAGLLSRNTYDLSLDLHSGKAARNGFWALHRDSQDVLAPAFKRFAQRWPVLNGDTRPYEMTTPGVGVSESPNTLKDLSRNAGTRWAVTVEAPGSVSYLDQVLGENDLVHEVVTQARARLYAEDAAASPP